MLDYNKYFSADVGNFMRSPVRDIFKKVDLNSIYSFAGGYPSAETFPSEYMPELTEKVLRRYGDKAFQYGATQGVTELREELSRRYNVEVGNIQITTSSQQGIDVCTRILINPGDIILTFNPTYLGALQSFSSYRADVRGIRYSDDLQELRANFEGVVQGCLQENKSIKFLYVIPDFQNPTGETLNIQERNLLLELSEKYSFLIVEDSPYKELRYEGEDIPSLYSYAPNRVIFLGSFSKIFAPGFRLGWIFANEEILDKIYVCKQSLDLCPPIFNQYLTVEYMQSGLLDVNLTKSKLLYKRKRDLLVAGLQRVMPKSVSWTYPEGGLFLFLKFPDSFDSMAFYDVALDAGVAYVAGNFFYTDGTGRNTMRLNFSFMSEDKIDKGIELLGRILKNYI